MSTSSESDQTVTLERLLAGLGCVPGMTETLTRLERKVEQLDATLRAKPVGETKEDGWIDAAKAAKYLDMSPGTFDKYRYNSEPKLKGYAVGGKTLYKREDLDLWVKLWALKSGGFA